VGERENKEGVKVCEAYEIKKKGGKYAVFYFAENRFFLYIYDVITSPGKGKRSTYHYSVRHLKLKVAHTGCPHN
jgi:hypothetical protein